MSAFRDPPAAGTITYRCPVCGATAKLSEVCSGCGRAPDPRASRLSTMDAELARLAEQVHRLRAAFDTALLAWRSAQATRDALASAILASHAAPVEDWVGSVAATASTSADADADADADSVRPSGTGTDGALPPAHRSAPFGRPDASPRTVQNLLFVLGAVLLGIAAIVFTAVAWTTYGVGGRSAILGIATLIAFAIPVVAMRRRLTATAETFTAIALLLLTLDGYGIWALNVFGAADRLAGTTYAGAVAAVVAAAAGGCGRLMRLTGPRFVAVIVAQPVLPLIFVGHGTSASAGAVCFAAVASADIVLATVRRRVDRTGVMAGVKRAEAVITWAFAFAALTIATVAAFGGLLNAATVGSAIGGAGAVAVVALVLAWTGWFASAEHVRTAAAAAAVIEVGIALVRLGIVATPVYPLAVTAVVTLAIVAGAWAIPQRWWLARGATFGAYGSTAVLGVATLAPLAYDVLLRAAGLTAWWHANVRLLTSPVDAAGHTIAVLGLITAAVVLSPGRHRTIPAVLGVAMLALSAGMIPGAPWWTMLVADGSAVVLLLGIAVPTLRTSHDAVARAATGGAAALALHASWFALARPVSTAAVQGGIVVCAAVLMLGIRGIGNRPTAVVVCGVSVATALLALPGFAAATAASGGADAIGSLRSALGAVAVGLATLPALRRRVNLRWYAVAAVIAPAMIVGFAALPIVPVDSAPIYLLTSLLLIVLVPAVVGLRGRTGLLATAAGLPLGLVAAAPLLAIVGDAFVEPYGWLGSIWSGAPSGVGLTPSSQSLTAYDLGAVLLDATVVIVVGVVAGGRRMAVRVGLHSAISVTFTVLVVAKAPWPTVPVVLFVAGAVAVVLAGFAWRGRGWEPGVVGLVALGAGAAGLAPVKLSSLCALGGMVVVASVVAVTGRTVVRRILAWVGTVVAADALAVAAARTAGATLGTTSYGILAAAAIALFIGATTRGGNRLRVVDAAGGSTMEQLPTRSRPESAALAALAHASALVAFMLCGSTERGAVITATWGALVGIRALWPALPSRARRVYASVAAGLELVAWWLLAAEHAVHIVEAYTLPLAAVALLCGWLAARGRPLAARERRLAARGRPLGSWIAYGPALLAAFLPSLAPALAFDASPTRRLVIGAAALVVVLIGAHGRLQAPVIVGGGTLVLLPLPELVFLWRILPMWLPLTVAGLVVLGCAITYERRRRDLARLRATIGRMA